MSEARAEHLLIRATRDAWRSVGLTVTDGGEVPFLFTSLRIDEPVAGEPVGGAPEGLIGWTFSGLDAAVTDIDGLPTEVVEPSTPALAEHPNGAIELDHVVVLTNSLDRTCGAIEAATGAPLKRVRELGAMRQGFHRIGAGGLIVEVVERPEVTDEHASFWGVVINVADLDAAVELIGPDGVSAPKDAVQPGRRIATVRASVGLATPVALMTP